MRHSPRGMAAATPACPEAAEEGSGGINRLWAEVANKMIYSKQR